MATPHRYPAPASTASRSAHRGAPSSRRRRAPTPAPRLAAPASPRASPGAPLEPSFTSTRTGAASDRRTREESGCGSRGGAERPSGRFDVGPRGRRDRSFGRRIRAGAGESDTGEPKAGAAGCSRRGGAHRAPVAAPKPARVHRPALRLHNRYFPVRHGESTRIGMMFPFNPAA